MSLNNERGSLPRDRFPGLWETGCFRRSLLSRGRLS